jgi:hypothetical protein
MLFPEFNTGAKLLRTKVGEVKDSSTYQISRYRSAHLTRVLGPQVDWV